MSNALATTTPNASALESVIAKNNLAELSTEQRVQYYMTVCQSLGLNPYTQPLAYLSLQGKISLYAKKDATDQLSRIHGVSVKTLSQEFVHDLFIVTVECTDKTGRSITEVGAVPVAGVKGEALANAIMKANTKARRRGILAFCGLGFLDESEVSSVPDANIVDFDDQIAPEPKKALPAPNKRARMEDKVAKLRMALLSEGLEDSEEVNIASLTDDQLVDVGKKLGAAWSALGLGDVEAYLNQEK